MRPIVHLCVPCEGKGVVGIIHKFEGQFDWDGVSAKQYPNDRARDVIKKILIGAEDGAHNFEIRYFEVAPGGHTSFDKHAHDHGVMVLRGKGQVLLGKEKYAVGFGDTIYIGPFEEHQFENGDDQPFGFICVSPART